MGSLFAHIRRVIDAEVAGIQFKAGNVGFRIALFAAAGIVALLGLLGLELAAFLALATVVAPPWAALLTAVGTFILAGVVVLIANGSKGEARLHEIELQKELARQEAKQDLQRIMSVASMTTTTLAALKKLRRSAPAQPQPPAVVLTVPSTATLPRPSRPPAIWRGATRNGLIGGVAALGFLVGVSPAVRRSMKRIVS